MVLELISLHSINPLIHVINLVLHEILESLVKLHCSLIDQVNEILLYKGLAMLCL